MLEVAVRWRIIEAMPLEIEMLELPMTAGDQAPRTSFARLAGREWRHGGDGLAGLQKLV
ncbi:hypothetical protein G6O69_38830 [Pseudenhygromyxa sp. WMMC2535]|nr:hypothetical protein [Pseudenhygromyxa sp. WMMC2535]NVB42405.1 hypothetical protein [Pseudenhygromyxa sp. WMMC2535]NVB43815.1 hypothetical protein [Pseudenhygromyxa sp. WMMC2535]